MIMVEKSEISLEEAAERLIDWHFKIEPELEKVYLFPSQSPPGMEPTIQLLEINGATLPMGSIEPFAFAPAGDIPYRVSVAAITPEELDKFQADPGRLPKGWELEKAKLYTRSEVG